AGKIVSSDHLIGKQSPKYRIDSSQNAVAKIRLFSRPHRVDVGGPENVKTRKPRAEQCILRLSLITSECDSASSRGIGTAATQERERSVRTTCAENSSELDGVVDGYCAELHIRHRSGIRAKAKDRGILIRQCLREC